MSVRHGIYVQERPTAIVVPQSVQSGIPFVIGASPIQSAETPAALGVPVLCRSFSEFQRKFGYSDDYEKYPLCEFAYVYFVIFGQRPMIACNLLDPSTMNTSVAAADIDVSAHRAELPLEAIDDTNLVVKSTSSGSALTKGTDYAVVYAGEKCYVEVLSGGSVYSNSKLNIAYKKVTAASVNASAVATGLSAIDLCPTKLGMIPNILAAPGYSQNATVAAAMALKANAIAGMFKAVCVVDLDASSVTTVSGAVTAAAGLTDKTQIVCWPMVGMNGVKFHLSSCIAARIAATDVSTGNIPARSPSNQDLHCDSLILASGTEVNLSLADADTLNAGGVVTAINFLATFKSFGNYTAAQPGSSDPKDTFIAFVRMFAYINNLTIQLLWNKLDEPLDFCLLDSLTDELNERLGAIVGAGYLLGARAEFIQDENPVEDLTEGIARIHIFITPAAPWQEGDFLIEYDAEYAKELFAEYE